jgi:hypothetical protein
MMDLKLIAYLWCGHAALALPIVALVAWLTRHRTHLSWWEGLVFLLPFAAWMSLMLGDWISRPKTLANLAECFFLGLPIILAASVRAFLGARGDGVGTRVVLLAAVTGAAVAMYLLIPMWPE